MHSPPQTASGSNQPFLCSIYTFRTDRPSDRPTDELGKTSLPIPAYAQRMMATRLITSPPKVIWEEPRHHSSRQRIDSLTACAMRPIARLRVRYIHNAVSYTSYTLRYPKCRNRGGLGVRGYPSNRKYITYRKVISGGRATVTGNIRKNNS